VSSAPRRTVIKRENRTSTIGLREASSAAFRAADGVANFTVKAKQAAIAQALRLEGALFRTNAQIPGGIKVVADLGIAIGTKGQTALRVIIKYPGRIVTAFPVRAP